MAQEPRLDSEFETRKPNYSTYTLAYYTATYCMLTVSNSNMIEAKIKFKKAVREDVTF